MSFTGDTEWEMGESLIQTVCEVGCAGSRGTGRLATPTGLVGGGQAHVD